MPTCFKTALLAFILLFARFSYAQQINQQITLHFKSNESLLSDADQHQLDSVCKALATHTIREILITGYTDNTAGNGYNLQLSEKRAAAARDYLIKQGIADSLITTVWKGEAEPVADNEFADGKSANRRVVIQITYTARQQLKPPVTAAPLPPDSCHLGDTVITLAGGTQLVFDLCEYRTIKECLDYVEILSTPQVVQNGLTLMDNDGFPIASCGMIGINVKEGCPNIPCFKYPVKVRFPRYPASDCDRCNRNANIYGINANGTWAINREGNSEIRIIKIGEQEYFQFSISCPERLNNCDCPKRGDDIVFKTKKQYRIVKLHVAYECPVMVIDVYKTDKPNIVKAKLPCLPTAKTIFATVLNENGDTLLLPPMPLNDLKKRARRNKCKAAGNETAYYWLGIFPVAKRVIYKQYMIQPGQLVKKHP